MHAHSNYYLSKLLLADWQDHIPSLDGEENHLVNAQEKDLDNLHVIAVQLFEEHYLMPIYRDSVGHLSRKVINFANLNPEIKNKVYSIWFKFSINLEWLLESNMNNWNQEIPLFYDLKNQCESRDPEAYLENLNYLIDLIVEKNHSHSLPILPKINKKLKRYISDYPLLSKKMHSIWQKQWANTCFQVFLENSNPKKMAKIIEACKIDQIKCKLFADCLKDHYHELEEHFNHPSSVLRHLTLLELRSFKELIEYLIPQNSFPSEKAWWLAVSLITRELQPSETLNAFILKLLEFSSTSKPNQLADFIFNKYALLSGKLPRLSPGLNDHHLNLVKNLFTQIAHSLPASNQLVGNPLAIIAAYKFDAEASLSMLPSELIGEILKQYIENMIVEQLEERAQKAPISTLTSIKSPLRSANQILRLCQKETFMAIALALVVLVHATALFSEDKQLA